MPAQGYPLGFLGLQVRGLHTGFKTAQFLHAGFKTAQLLHAASTIAVNFGSKLCL